MPSFHEYCVPLCQALGRVKVTVVAALKLLAVQRRKYKYEQLIVIKAQIACLSCLGCHLTQMKVLVV